MALCVYMFQCRETLETAHSYFPLSRLLLRSCLIVQTGKVLTQQMLLQFCNVINTITALCCTVLVKRGDNKSSQRYEILYRIFVMVFFLHTSYYGYDTPICSMCFVKGPGCGWHVYFIILTFWRRNYFLNFSTLCI